MSQPRAGTGQARLSKHAGAKSPKILIGSDASRAPAIPGIRITWWGAIKVHVPAFQSSQLGLYNFREQYRPEGLEKPRDSRKTDVSCAVVNSSWMRPRAAFLSLCA